MSNQYADNSMPFGSRVETVKRSGAALGAYKFENIRISRPTRITERPNEVGSTKGTPGDDAGPAWSGVELCPTMTATLQIPASSSPVPRPLTDYFIDTFDGSTAGTAETYVFTEVGQLFSMDGYFKCDVSLRFSANPPSA